MKSSLATLLPLLAGATSAAVACTSSGSGTPIPSDGGIADGSPDDGQPFCNSAAAAGAAFCADFEQSTSVEDGWGGVTMSGGATLTLETAIAQQKKSALAKLVSVGSDSGTAAFSAVANASSAQSKVALEFDGRFSFPGGAPAANTLFLTIALRTGSGPSGHYFIDIERGSGGWQLLATGTSGEPFLSFSDDAWHHFRLSYDGSGAQGEIRLFIDSAGVASISRPKGPPPGGAPETLDNVLIEHLGVDAASSVSFYVDNVIVTYP